MIDELPPMAVCGTRGCPNPHPATPWVEERTTRTQAGSGTGSDRAVSLAAETPLPAGPIARRIAALHPETAPRLEPVAAWRRWTRDNASAKDFSGALR